MDKLSQVIGKGKESLIMEIDGRLLMRVPLDSGDTGKVCEDCKQPAKFTMYEIQDDACAWHWCGICQIG